MSDFQAIAWDIDGTLIDSEPLHHQALVTACSRYNLRISPDDQSFIGVHIDDVWKRLQPRFPGLVDKRSWQHEIWAAYSANSDTLTPIQGALETVSILAQKGIPQICVSNSNRSVVDVNLRHLGINDLLIGSISLDDVAAGKPDPAPYRMAVQALGVAPQKILAVEDSLTGMRSAHTAGLKVALLGTTELVADPRANFHLEALSDVTKLLGC